MRHGQQASGISRMPGDENQIAVLHSGARPLQVIIEVRRLAILVDPEEGDIQVVARIGEVIGISAKESNVEFGSEHQPHVRVLFILVEVIDLPRIKNHHIAAQSSCGGAILFNLRHGGALGLPGVRRRHPGLYSCVDFVRHVLNSDKLIEFKVWTLSLFCLRLSVKTGLDIVAPLGRKLLDASRSHVMVGKGQSIRRNERAGTAVVESHRRQANVVEPLLRQLEAVCGFDFVLRRFVIEPHALVGAGQCRKDEGEGKQNCEKAFHFWWILHEE